MGLAIIFVISVMLMTISMSMLKNNKSREIWVNDKFKELDIGMKNTEFILHGVQGHNIMAYTKDKMLYVLNSSIKVVDKINISEILNIEVDMHVSEKNTKRVVALTSTYDKKSKINDVRFKVTTREGVFMVQYIPGRNSLDDQFLKNIDNKVNQINRCKLILEDDIKKLNKSKI